MSGLVIRRFVKEDLDPLYRLLSDPSVMRYIEPVFDYKKTEAFLNQAGLGVEPLIYAVEEDGRFAGYLINHAYDDHSIETGWILLPDVWGKGIACRLTEYMIQKAEKEKKDLVIECLPQQEVSIHIALKYGFTEAGKRDGCVVYRRFFNGKSAQKDFR